MGKRRINVLKNEEQKDRSRLSTILSTNFYNLSMKIFKYEGLPDEVDSDIMEHYLYHNGQILFLKDNENGYLTLPATPDQNLNVYNRTNKYRAIGNGFSKSYFVTSYFEKTGVERKPDAVLMKNNASGTPAVDVVNYYVEKLVNLEQAIDTNVNATKQSVMFSGDEKDILTFKNIFKKVVGNEPVVYVDKSFGENSFKSFNTQADFYADKYLQLYREYENKLLTFLGLKNNPENKKERLLVDEVNKNNEYINANLSAMFDDRKKAVEKVNELFNLNISVKLNEEIFEDDTMFGYDEDEEVEVNGELHD